MNLLQQFAANQAVVAIDIADADAEEQARAEIVGLADPYPVGGIMPLELIAVHQAGSGAHQLEEAGQLADIVLAVAIGVEYEIFLGRLEPATQRTSVTAILFMGHHPQALAVLLLELLQHLA